MAVSLGIIVCAPWTHHPLLSGALRPMHAISSRDKWNARHLESRGLELDPTSAWLRRHESLLREAVRPDTRALDVACGRGRHSLYLAKLGFIVDAWDISEVAVAELSETAERHNLAIRAKAVDLTLERPPADRYDAVVVTRYLDRELFPALEQSLKPGGLLLYETFVADPNRESSMNPDFLLEPGELPTLVPNLDVLSYEQTSPTSDAGRDRPQGRLLARLPINPRCAP